MAYRGSDSRAEIEERVAEFEDVSFTSAGLIITLAKEVDWHQRTTTDILANPLPKAIPKDLAADMRRNTSDYDPAIEEVMSEDEVMQRIIQAEDPHEMRGAAIRARRSAIVLVLLAYQQAAASDTMAA